MKFYYILGHKKAIKKSLVILYFFSFLNDFLIYITEDSQKKIEKLIDSSFYSPKTNFLAIFANFGQLWMVVYTATIKIFEIF